MGIGGTLDALVLKASAIISSVYVSALMLMMVLHGENDVVNKQAVGFIALFYIALLVYLVM